MLTREEGFPLLDLIGAALATWHDVEQATDEVFDDRLYGDVDDARKAIAAAHARVVWLIEQGDGELEEAPA
jgi:hypothetical protein